MHAKTYVAKPIVAASLKGELVVVKRQLSFYGDIDPEKGLLKLNSKTISIKGKILAFPYSSGSTVGSYIIFRMKKLGTNPKAMITLKAEPIVIIGCLIARIPLFHKVNPRFFTENSTGYFVNIKTINEKTIIETVPGEPL
ncbi:acetyltransferase [archaeon]|nr:MAG: acetyltransferase [archaeon]RLG65156.1 MAG: acetyltransferase [archaeon]HDM23336.1 DUF126 domain-containing protein [Candidatus Bathyarchaeota archaeon]